MERGLEEISAILNLNGETSEGIIIVLTLNRGFYKSIIILSYNWMKKEVKRGGHNFTEKEKSQVLKYTENIISEKSQNCI